MQPETPRRPVMDVTVPPRPNVPLAPRPGAVQVQTASVPAVASAPVPVHEAPKVDEPSAPVTPSAAPATTEVLPTHHQTPIAPPKQKQASTAPIGTIIVTLFVMVALATLAIAVYMKS